MDRFISVRKYLYVLLFLLAPCGTAWSQHTFQAVVKDEHHGEPLIGVNVVVEGTAIGATTDTDGVVVISGVPAGRQVLVFSFVGFETVRRAYTFPLPNTYVPDIIYLEEAERELEGISVEATRTSRTIADLPMRVETIAGEEIDEKISMDPSSISMLLMESPGVTVQQTSATSGNATIRIQGLDGRYTQILQDGFPLYGGFAGGLSILQIPPLDLRQVEIIKGPASTLYGGDAIAGLINLVTKTPADEPELSLLANATSAGGFDLGGFYQGRGEKLGLTILATANVQQAYDPDDDFFSNLPQTRRFTAKPRVFYYIGSGTTLSAGASLTTENRQGGDLFVIRNGPGGERTFFEHNHSTRLTSRLRLDHNVPTGRIVLKNSFSLFERQVEIPSYTFDGRQLASYSEASFGHTLGQHDLVAGLDLRTDAFRERNVQAGGDPARDYTYATVGLFAQDTWDVMQRLSAALGLRADYQNEFGLFVLPNVSALYRWSNQLSTRVGGGLGYKAPTVFLEQSEERAFQGVLPLDGSVRPETSRGGSIDVNYRALLFGRIALTLNQAFYFTRLDDPLLPDAELLADGLLRYRNADGAIHTRALETNAKFALDDFKLFLGYVYLDAHTDFEAQKSPLALTPDHKTYTVLVYERHGKGRIGLEAYYTSPQRLSSGERMPGYWITGLMGQLHVGPAKLFLNFENFLGTKQSNYAPVVLGTRSEPEFAEIWGPLDGFIINGGVKYTL